jgi:hypothetical protein
MKNIVEQLKQAVARSHKTEYAIAKGAGVSQSVLNRFMHGESRSAWRRQPNSASISSCNCDDTRAGSKDAPSQICGLAA